MFVPVFLGSIKGLLIFAELFSLFHSLLCYFGTRERVGPHVPISRSCCVFFYWSLRFGNLSPLSPQHFAGVLFRNRLRLPLPPASAWAQSWPKYHIHSYLPISNSATEFCLALGRAIIGGPALSCCILPMATRVFTLCHKLTLFLKQSQYTRVLQPVTGRFIEAKFR